MEQITGRLISDAEVRTSKKTKEGSGIYPCH
jgi:hypothetical protein